MCEPEWCQDMKGFVAKLYTEEKKKQVQNDLLKNLEGCTRFLREKDAKQNRKTEQEFTLLAVKTLVLKKKASFSLFLTFVFK